MYKIHKTLYLVQDLIPVSWNNLTGINLRLVFFAFLLLFQTDIGP